jgi:threonine synthase
MASIKYLSTRKDAAGKGGVGIEEAIASGMPSDGGLFVPDKLPSLPARIFQPEKLGYAELAYLVLEPFFPDWGPKLRFILERAYGSLFDHPEIAPVRELGSEGQGLYLLELFHGPTCAFKDMALSLLGGFLRESLDRLGRKEPVLVLTATSGDTGSAALAGLSGVEGVHTAVFYPSEGTSEIQRLQMTCTSAERRYVAGLRGNFDDAQRAVKRAFARAAAGEGPLAGIRLSSANSINIGRLLPQIVYYVAAWRRLREEGRLGPGGAMHVAVPTGNFGDILAAKYAKEMGLPIASLVCASNANKVLADFFATGVYDRKRDLVRTESPSMDILVSSNLERLLYMASGGDGDRVAFLMRQLNENGGFEISEDEQRYMKDFAAGWCSDAAAKSMIAEVWRSDSVLVDPHTATGLEVATRLSQSLRPEAPILVAATASPFKFPRACLDALAAGAEAVSASAQNGGRADLRLGDLGRAEKLARLTGLALPKAIAGLKGKPVTHEAMLDPQDVEAALAEYVARNFGVKS